MAIDEHNFCQQFPLLTRSQILPKTAAVIIHIDPRSIPFSPPAGALEYPKATREILCTGVLMTNDGQIDILSVSACTSIVG